MFALPVSLPGLNGKLAGKGHGKSNSGIAQSEENQMRDLAERQTETVWTKVSCGIASSVAGRYSRTSHCIFHVVQWTQFTQKEEMSMKKNLERISGATFRSLDNLELLGTVGGSSTSHTVQQTFINGQPVEFIADVRID